MNDEAWREDFEERQAARRDEGTPTDDDSAWAEDAAWDDPAVSLFDQIMRGVWPVRVPLTMEIYAEGTVPQIHQLKPGQRRRNPASHIITLELEFDRAKIRELMLEQIHAPSKPGESKLPDIMGLARVDRQCFLKTVAAHFVDLFSEADTALRRDPWRVGFLRELHDVDADLIGDLVAETIRADCAAGARLRDVILDTLSEPEAREHLGWLVAAAITDRLQEL